MKEHEQRKNEILDTSGALFYRYGYDNTSVATIIDAVGIAKGTFYHYFKSKEDLLDQLVSRRFRQMVPELEEIAADQNRGALEKLLATFHKISAWKVTNKELMVEMIKAMGRDENALLLRKTYRMSIEYYAPVITRIVTQGVTEGVFDTKYPDQAGKVIFRLSIGMSEEIISLFLDVMENPVHMERLLESIEVFEYSIERIIGAPEGSLRFTDRKLVEVFTQVAAERRETAGV